MRDKEVRIRMVDYLIHRTHERQESADKNGATHNALRRPTVYCEQGETLRGVVIQTIEWPLHDNSLRYAAEEWKGG